MGKSSLLQALRLRAEIQPLKGKYYGSYVNLIDEKGNETDSIQVWVMGDYKPSQREIEVWNEDENGPYEVCDSHFESVLGYEICQLIASAINGE